MRVSQISLMITLRLQKEDKLADIEQKSQNKIINIDDVKTRFVKALSK